MNNLKKEILECLGNLKGSGNFASVGSVPFVLPGLCINNSEEVSFPISDIEANKLIKWAINAPFGLGKETFVDTSVRKTWEIDASKIQFANSQWNTQVDSILKIVKADLGLKAYTIQANLYKLLIYEEGGFFLQHKDSEKEKGMFGTLIIGLPSSYTGGELLMTFDKEIQIADFSKGNKYNTDFAAFYADCDHEVKKVNSGFRVCLVYNLIQKESGEKIQWSSVSRGAVSLASIFNKHQHLIESKPSIILLGHQYTPENFCQDHLKLNDRLKAKVIQEASNSLGYYSKLCLVTSFKSGSPEYDGYYEYGDEIDAESETMSEVYDEELYIEYWEESELPELNKVSFEEEDLITSFKLDDDEAIVKESSGYMGNYGPDLTFWYHYGAVMVWPKSVNADLFGVQNLTTKLQWIAYFNTHLNISIQEKKVVDNSIMFDLHQKDKYLHEKNVNLDSVVDWIIIQKNESIFFNLGNENLQDYFEKISPMKWLEFLNYLSSENIDRFFEKITIDSNLKVIEQLIELLLVIQKDSALAAVQYYWANNLPELLNSGCKKTEDRILKQTLVNLLSLEKALQLSGSWSLEIWKVIAQNTNRKEIHQNIAPVVLENKGDSVLLVQFKSLSIEFLNNLIKNKPIVPENWTRAIPNVKNYQNQWKELKEFMDSPILQIFDYRKPQNERGEMQSAIKNVTVDLKLETIKKGSPHTLRITKTQDEYLRQLKKWELDLALLKSIMSAD